MDCSVIKDVFISIAQWCAGRTDVEENLYTLRDTIGELKSITYDVIEVQPRETNPMKKELAAGWLERANAVETEVNEIIREIEGRCLGGFCRNCYASYKTGEKEKVVRIIEKIAELKVEGRYYDNAGPALALQMPAVPMTGQDSILEETWRCISEERVGIVGIYGIGGVGKTAILKMINNEIYHRGTLNFDVVIWVTVSKEICTRRIQDDIANRLGFSLPTDESLNCRASMLCSALSKKKVLLLLDDVWERVDLYAIGISYLDVQNKSKVVVTTRSLAVCALMDAHKMIRVECLDWPEAWNLFQETVGEEALSSHPEIPELAQNVAGKCSGLPLALLTVGRAMSSKKTPEEWKHAETILEESTWELSGMGDEVFPVLMFSYHNLPNDTIRSCFLYCSLFPKDESIKIDQLVRFWIGEGLLDGFHDIDEAQRMGYFIIRKLIFDCLLEHGRYSPTEEVRMLGILRDLALWIGCDHGRKKHKFLVQSGGWNPLAWQSGEAERISVMNSPIPLMGYEALKCPNLLTLIMSSNMNISSICDGFFHYMHALRVLDLSNTHIRTLPMSIVELVELKYLGLAGTDITELPREMKNLVKLKILDLSNTKHLKFIPCRTLLMLSELQVLDFTDSSFEHWEPESCGQVDEIDGASIEELECMKDLKFLSISISNADSLKSLLRFDKFTRCSIMLCISQCHGLITLPPMLTIGWPLKHKRNEVWLNLRKLHIFSCNSLQDLSWVSGARNLEFLRVEYCESLQAICNGTADGCFRKLRQVDILHCNALKDLSWIRSAAKLESLFVNGCMNLLVICDGLTDPCFPYLRHVNIMHCNALKDLSWIDSSGYLESVTVYDCPNLIAICDGVSCGCFPNLRQVDIQHCNELKNLSWIRGALNLESLDVCYCKGLELICDDEDAEAKENPMTFSCLRSLTLMDLPELKKIPWHSIPLDTQTMMENCPKAPLKLSTR